MLITKIRNTFAATEIFLDQGNDKFTGNKNIQSENNDYRTLKGTLNRSAYTLSYMLILEKYNSVIIFYIQFLKLFSLD